MGEARQTKQTSRFRFWLLLIALIGVIVPRRLRADWRQEWEAELHYREALLAEWDNLNFRTKLNLLWRSLGAFWDALLLQPQRLEDEMFQDLRFGVRMLLKHKGFTTVAILTLALGIGANTVIFGVVYGVLLRPLPYQQPSQLVAIWGTNPKAGVQKEYFSEPNFVDLQQQAKTVERMTAFADFSPILNQEGEATQLAGSVTSVDFFSVLGAKAFLGRTFLAEEGQAGRDDVVVLSYGIWQRRFGADPKLIGKLLLLDGKSHTVIGVMPRNFIHPAPDERKKAVELWKPLVIVPRPERRGSDYLSVVARLDPGAACPDAQAEMSFISNRLEQQYPSSNAGSDVLVVPLHEELVGQVRKPLWVIFGAVAFLFLIACTNVANLALARATSRQRELAVRCALGAGRSRLFRQLLTESMLLGLMSGGLGLVVAVWGLEVVVTLGAGHIPQIDQVQIEPNVVAFTSFVSLLAGALFGLAPALQVFKAEAPELLKGSGRSPTAGGQHRRIQSLLVVSEVALALLLLIGGMLMMNSFVRLQHVSPGFRTEGVFTAQIALPWSKYANDHRARAFYQQLLERITALPVVDAAGAVRDLPLTGSGGSWSFQIEERRVPAGALPDIQTNIVTPNYFATIALPLKMGRWFTERDSKDAPRVALINETAARQFWPNETPIGKRITVGVENPRAGDWVTIVGIVGDMHHRDLVSASEPQVYVPHLQETSGLMHLVVHTREQAASLASDVREAIRSIDKDQAVSNLEPMDRVLAESLGQPRFNTFLLNVFGLLALTLTIVGIYGVISYSVTQRTQEIGIRLALGAQRSDILRLVIGQGMAPIVCGMAIGLAAAIALTRVMSGLLFEIRATDPPTFVGVAFVLGTVALLACYIPAQRATKVDPLTTLRHE